MVVEGAYFDVSCLAKCYLDEVGSDATVRVAVDAGRVLCSLFGRIELISAFRRARRERRLSSGAYAAVLRRLAADDAHDLVGWLAVTQATIAATVDHLTQVPTAEFVRAGDALHLATARSHGLTEIWSTDRRLLAAAAGFGLRGRDPTAQHRRG